MLISKGREHRRLSKALYEQDYLDFKEMDSVIRGIGLDKEKEDNKVRTWDQEKYGPAFQWLPDIAIQNQQTKSIHLSI